jgi:PTH2 family peptidyl-tRNA hydrolase
VIKQVIAVRIDLKMGKGKLAAQVAHASLEASEESRKIKKEWYETWRREGQAKVVLRVSTKDELEEVLDTAISLGLPASLIKDRGLTQLEPGTVTCVGIGPAPVELIDKVTGKLKLL